MDHLTLTTSGIVVLKKINQFCISRELLIKELRNRRYKFYFIQPTIYAILDVQYSLLQVFISSFQGKVNRIDNVRSDE